MIPYGMIESHESRNCPTRVKRTKVKPRQASQQEGTKSSNSSQFIINILEYGERRLGRLKKILISAIPTFVRFYGIGGRIPV